MSVRRLGLSVILASLLFAVFGSAAAQDKGSLDKDLEKWRVKLVQMHEAERNLRTKDGTRGAWAIAPDGLVIAAGTPAGRIEVWRADGTEPARVLEGHPDLVESIAFEGSSILHTIGWEGTLRTWNLDESEPLVRTVEPQTLDVFASETLRRLLRGFSQVAVSSDGRHMALVAPGWLDVCVVEEAKWLGAKRWRSSTTASARFLPSQRHLLVETSNAISAYDIEAAPAIVRDEVRRDQPVWTVRLDDPANDWSQFITLVVADRVGLVIGCARTFDKHPPRMRAWDAATGKLCWSVDLKATGSLIMEARDAGSVVLRTPAGVEFRSAKDGTVERFVPMENDLRPSILAPDASVGYTADRSGSLVRISLAQAPSPPTEPAPPAPPK